VHVRGKGVDLELLVSRDFTMRWTDRLMVFGSLTAPSGSVEAMGGSFALLSGSELRFEGPPEAPFVDLGASGSLGGGELSLFAHGRRGELQLGAGGDREASELAIYSLLATGEAQLARGAPRPLAHSRVEGAGWGSALARYLATQFPLDALLGRGTPSSTHEASAVVTGQVEARAIARLGADPLRGENARANEIAVRLGPDARIRARFGDAAAAGLDVLWIHERQPGGAGPNNPDARAEHRSARRPRPQRR
jgi:translocation and assembly module TamB